MFVFLFYGSHLEESHVMTFVLANWQEFLEILPENISEFYAVKIEIVYGDAAGPTAVCQC